MVGLGGTAITFGLPKLVAEGFSPTRSGTLSSVYLLGSYLGIAAAFGLGRAILGPLLGGWRPVFRWSGLAVLAFALVWIAAVGWVSRRDDRDADRRAGGTDTERAASDPAAETGTGVDDEAGTAVRSIAADLKRVGTHPEMRLLVLIRAMYLFTLHGLQNWLAVALEARGIAPS
ncbi:hypothetical protein BRC86_05060, partial [Halobacteriales archaeon QS_3_64_16]